MKALDIGMRIRDLRERVGLTQKQLAEKLGIQRTALVQIEAGARKLTAEEMLASAQLFNITVEQLMCSQDLPEVSRGGTDPAPHGDRIRISVPSRDTTKFKEILLFILERVGARPHVGEMVIYKLLYFADFDHYEKYEEQLTGASYIRNHHGPTPESFRVIVDQMEASGDLERVKSEYFIYPQTKFLPRRSPDLSILSAQELDTVNGVLFRLGDMSACQISDYSHGDVPWVVTEDGKEIAYQSVFYRLPPYSVREYLLE